MHVPWPAWPPLRLARKNALQPLGHRYSGIAPPAHPSHHSSRRIRRPRRPWEDSFLGVPNSDTKRVQQHTRPSQARQSPSMDSHNTRRLSGVLSTVWADRAQDTAGICCHIDGTLQISNTEERLPSGLTPRMIWLVERDTHCKIKKE